MRTWCASPPILQESSKYMKDPIILRRDDSLSPIDAGYWKDLLYRVTKIGTEIEVSLPKSCTRPDFEKTVCEVLLPSGSLDNLGPNGVLDVTSEHCGIEIRVIGRQPHFRALHRQYHTIFNKLLDLGARSRPTCGLHFHLLTPTLAEPVPEIILSNLWNLVRRYAPELRYLTSGGDSRQALCRRRNHTSHLEMVRYSPATMHMADIQNELKSSRIVPEHQNFLNIEHIGFTETGAVLPFHLEFRFPDADLSVTSVVAKTFLFLAMLLKAVDLSQYGVIHVGKITPWRRKVELLGILNNNEGDLATSNTSALTEDMLEELRQGCYELLDLLGPIFEHFEDNPSLDVLIAMTENPVSLLRCAGYNWQEIDTLFSQRAALDEIGLDDTDRRLMQRIELGEWYGQPSAESWQWYAARELFLTPQDLERRMFKIEALRGLRWDCRQGTMVFMS
jgi:hypothetical protein